MPVTEEELIKISNNLTEEQKRAMTDLIISYACKPVLEYIVHACDSVRTSKTQEEQEIINAMISEIKQIAPVRDTYTVLPVVEYGKNIGYSFMIVVGDINYTPTLCIPNDSYKDILYNELDRMRMCALAFLDIFKSDYPDLWKDFVQITGFYQLELSNDDSKLFWAGETQKAICIKMELIDTESRAILTPAK